jgi:hypothetical protein
MKDIGQQQESGADELSSDLELGDEDAEAVKGGATTSISDGKTASSIDKKRDDTANGILNKVG